MPNLKVDTIRDFKGYGANGDKPGTSEPYRGARETVCPNTRETGRHGYLTQ